MKYFLFLIILCALTLIGRSIIVPHLIYFPNRSVSYEAKAALNAAGFVAYLSGDETAFRGWLRPSSSPQRIIVAFHGNAGNAADRLYMVRKLLSDENLIYLAEYPGYGNRVGKFSEHKLFEAALSDLREIQKKYPALPVIFIGESLGTGVASWLSQQLPAQGLILVSPFTTLADVAKFHYTFLPTNLLLADRFESKKHLIHSSSVPLLILHGDRDEVVPYQLGKELYDSYPGPKKMITLEGYGHNNLPWNDHGGSLWQAVDQFLKGLKEK